VTLKHIFIGVDVRQPVAFTALQSSIIARASEPVAITPLLIDALPVKRRGLTDFTFTRYLPPYLMGYEGISLFLENDAPHALEWGAVGDLPKEWNHCVGYDAPNPDAKLIHYTMGIPAFKEVQHLERADEWKQEIRAANSTVGWKDLMGGSVHERNLNATIR
jgi:hypothetical protein